MITEKRAGEGDKPRFLKKSEAAKVVISVCEAVPRFHATAQKIFPLRI
jgi:hypothetical protein